jgi:HSP20 family molecular chaperone IbpA
MNTYNTFRNGGRFATLLGWDPMRLSDDLVTWPMGSEVVWSAYPSPVHATQDEDRATITIDMPGVDEQDLDLSYEAGHHDERVAR